MPASTRFEASQFTTTPYHGGTAEDKARAATALLAFLRAGCPESKFTERIYRALSLHSFGHIAEWGRTGFWNVWFSTPERRAEWIAYACRGGARGFKPLDRTDLWGDWERLVVRAIESERLTTRYYAEAEMDLEARERAELERLKAKWEPAPTEGTDGNSAWDRAIAHEDAGEWRQAAEAWEEAGEWAKAAEAWTDLDWDRAASAHEMAGDPGEAAEARAAGIAERDRAAAEVNGHSLGGTQMDEIVFVTADLYDKFGFADGDLLYDFVNPDSGDDSQSLLREVVETLILPRLDQRVELEEDLHTIHNSVRAARVDGVDVSDAQGNEDGRYPTLAPATIRVPIRRILEISGRGERAAAAAEPNGHDFAWGDLDSSGRVADEPEGPRRPLLSGLSPDPLDAVEDGAQADELDLTAPDPLADREDSDSASAIANRSRCLHQHGPRRCGASFDPAKHPSPRSFGPECEAGRCGFKFR